MSFCAISDVHVKSEDDFSFELLQKFFQTKEVLNSSHIFLLGDIFDLLLGSHQEYLHKYSKFFDLVAEKMREGKSIFFFEGNHDFHLEELFDSFCSLYQLNLDQLVVVRGHLIHEEEGKLFYLSHGDDIELNNPNYQRYRKIIRSRFFSLFISQFLSFKNVEFIGQRASLHSKGKNIKKYKIDYNEDFVRLNFRNSAKKVRDQFQVDYVICGHSHVQDMYLEREFIYANCGHLPSTQNFLYFDSVLEFIKL